MPFDVSKITADRLSARKEASAAGADERIAMELALIADTLEALRLDFGLFSNALIRNLGTLGAGVQRLK